MVSTPAVSLCGSKNSPNGFCEISRLKSRGPSPLPLRKFKHNISNHPSKLVVLHPPISKLCTFINLDHLPPKIRAKDSKNIFRPTPNDPNDPPFTRDEKLPKIQGGNWQNLKLTLSINKGIHLGVSSSCLKHLSGGFEKRSLQIKP